MSEVEKYNPDELKEEKNISSEELSLAGFTEKEIKGFEEIDVMIDSMSDESLEALVEQKYLESENKDRYDGEIQDLFQEAKHFGLEDDNLVWITLMVMNGIWGKSMLDIDEFHRSVKVIRSYKINKLLRKFTPTNIIKRSIFNSSDQREISDRMDKVAAAIKDVIENGKGKWNGN